MIHDYSELIVEAAHRSGAADVTGRAGMFVAMAEKMLSRRLRLAEMEANARFETDADGAADLPDDYQEMRLVQLNGRELPRYSLAAMLSGKAKGYAVQGRRLRTSYSDAALDGVYYAAIPPLADADDGSTWLLAREPEIYLQAVLFQVYAAAGAAETAQTTAVYLTSLIAAANDADHLARHAGTRIRIEGATP